MPSNENISHRLFQTKFSSEQKEIAPEPEPERQKGPYKAALELELWKELEQEKFMKGLVKNVSNETF